MKTRAATRKAISPRKLPQQARSTQTVEIILEAATRILSKESLAGFNTNRVAEVAGISVGSLYQYFPNKAALTATLVLREQRKLHATLSAALAKHASASLETMLGAAIDVAISHQYASPVFAAALDHEEVRLPIAAELAQSRAEAVATLHAALEARPHLITVPDALDAAYDCFTIVKAMIEAPQTAKRLATLRSRTLRAVLGYLGLKARSSDKNGTQSIVNTAKLQLGA